MKQVFNNEGQLRSPNHSGPPSPEPTCDPQGDALQGSDQEGPALVRGTQSHPPCEGLSRHMQWGNWE